jgi:hypothetical protein
MMRLDIGHRGDTVIADSFSSSLLSMPGNLSPEGILPGFLLRFASEHSHGGKAWEINDYLPSRGSGDRINRQYPRLWQYGSSWTTLIRSFPRSEWYWKGTYPRARVRPARGIFKRLCEREKSRYHYEAKGV